jgi:hypothetical protein
VSKTKDATASWQILTDDESDALIIALGMGQATFTKKDAEKLFEWAEKTRMSASILQNVINGDMAVSMKTPDGEPTFSLTEKGKRSVEGMRR